MSSYMKYVFDTNTLNSIFKFYYQDTFRGFWQNFNSMVKSGEIVSVKEVRRELSRWESWTNVKAWASNYQDFFANPTEDELQFITRIYAVKHFQQNIEQRKLLKGEPVADAFVIARAAVNDATIVSEEKFRPNAAKIPNICRYFKIDCIYLKEFLVKEGWHF